MNRDFETRALIEVNHINPPQVYAPEAVIIKGESSDGSIFRLDIGRFCYLDRERASQDTRSGKNFKSLQVKASSLSQQRIQWFRNYLDSALRQGWRGETLRARFYYLQYFFNFCDFGTGSKPTTLNSLTSEYQLFTNFLSQQGRMTGSSQLGSSAIQGRLKTARQFIQWACELQESDMLSLIPIPRFTAYNVNSESKRISLQDGQVFLRACSTYFNQFSDAIFQNEYPISLPQPEKPSDKLYWYSTQLPPKKIPIFLDSNKELLAFQKIKQELTEAFGGKYHSARQFYYEVLLKKRNLWQSETLTYYEKYAFNLSSYCFFNLYLAVTGANIQPTLDLKMSDIDLKKMGRSSFAKKHKFRAGRSIDYRAPSHLKPEFLKYIRLRDWASKLGLTGDGEEYLFVKIRENGTLSRMPQSSRILNPQKSQIFEGIPTVPPSQLRQLTGEFFIRKSSGKISLVAKKLNNSIATVSRSYTAVDIETQAVEMNQFHEELTHKIRTFNRTTGTQIPVKMSGNTNSQGIAAGSCTNLGGESPQRVTGYNQQAPEPSCGTFETCLFCSHFAVHIDSEDIQKLLSMREALRITSGIRNDPEHHQAVIQPALYRIDEIVEFVSNMNPKGKQAFNEAKEKIDVGIFNTYWAGIIHAITNQKDSSKTDVTQSLSTNEVHPWVG